MKGSKKKRLKSAGWRVGTADEFLGLTEEETRIVEMKLALGDSLKRHRLKKGLTQQELAKKFGSSQSRIAKLETGALGVTLDLLFRALFAAGVSLEEVARKIRHQKRPVA